MASSHEALATALKFHQSGDLQKAERAYKQVLRSEPRNADALHLLGVIAHQVGKHELAIKYINRAIAVNPLAPAFHASLGGARLALGELDDAIESYQIALRLQPENVDGHVNLGIALRTHGRSEEAVASYDRALQLKPDNLNAIVGMGNAWRDQCELDQAIACFRRALAIEPNYAPAHRNLAMSLLSIGDFDAGWMEYEWRGKTNTLSSRDFPQPKWDGRHLDARIFVHAEQGLGDTIQFFRYLPLVKQRVNSVVFECQKPLVTLMQDGSGIDHLVTVGDDLPAFDFYSPLLSLPRIFETSLDTIPADTPYLFADPKLVEDWRSKLNARMGNEIGMKVGICWQGSRERSRDRWRSIPLQHFTTLAQIPSVNLVSLQKGDEIDQRHVLDNREAIVDLGCLMFPDTAAVMMNLDLVVTCDTSIGHLAGALGVPVWLALGFACDWRWLQDREDSPWYPSMRLFRQPKFGDWESVFQRIAAALQDEASAAE